MSLYTLGDLDDYLIEQALGFNLKQNNKKMLFNILEPLMDDDYKNKGFLDLYFMRSYLTYCPLCMVNSYHSLFHQFLFIQKCPFHYIRLQNKCPQCHQRIPYVLNDNFFQSPFQCKCGFKFSQIERRITSYKNLRIKDPNLSNWLKLGESSSNNRLSTMIMLEALAGRGRYEEEDFNYELSDLFSLIYRQDHIVTTKEFIEQTRSIPQIIETRIKKLRKYDLYVKYHDYKISSLELEAKYYCNQLFSSIARQLRNTILKRHINCIKQFTRCRKELTRREVCPYAFAYTYWRSRLQEFKKMEYVDNYGTTPFYREHFTYYGYPFNNGYDIISEFLEKIKREDKNGTRALFYWKLNRFLGEHILADFKRCLIAANDFINGNKFDRDYVDSFDLLTKVIIEPPAQPNNKYFLYLKCISTVGEISKNLKCPNNTVKKRRGSNLNYKNIDPVLEIFDKL